MLCRTDLALPFFREFASAFKESSDSALKAISKGLPSDIKLPDALTVSGGIALIKANQPFMQCHDLVESLCKTAKGKGKARLNDGAIPPAMVSFHRVAATMIHSVEDIREHEWKVSDNYQTSLEAYCLEESSELPQLSDLLAMQELFSGPLETEKLTMNRLREIATLVKESKPQAVKAYRRWQEVAEKNEHRKPKLKQFIQYLEKLTHGQPGRDLPFANITSESDPQKWISPLADLLTIKYLVANNTDKEANNG